MTTVSQLDAAIKGVLCADREALGRATGFTQRRSKMTAATFVQTLVLGWLGNPAASLSELAQMAGCRGVAVTAQGLDERFGEAASHLLLAVLRETMSVALPGERRAGPLLERFDAVYLIDSSHIRLPAALAPLWPSLRDNQGRATAGVKVQLRLDYTRGTLSRLHIGPGREQDRATPVQADPLPSGSLRVADMGYFTLPNLAATAAAGAYFLTRLRAGTALYDPTGQRLDLRRLLSDRLTLDSPVLVGTQQRLPCRLLAQRVPQEVADQRRRRLKEAARIRQKAPNPLTYLLADWTILLTNVPATLLSLPEALVILRLRWQIELLFKLWKSQGALAHSRSRKPWRCLCEVYAKLTALIIQQWCLQAGCWHLPDRSLTRASHIIRALAPALATVLDQPRARLRFLRTLVSAMPNGATLDKRKAQPNIYQLCLAAAQGLA